MLVIELTVKSLASSWKASWSSLRPGEGCWLALPFARRRRRRRWEGRRTKRRSTRVLPSIYSGFASISPAG